LSAFDMARLSSVSAGMRPVDGQRLTRGLAADEVPEEVPEPDI